MTRAGLRRGKAGFLLPIRQWRDMNLIFALASLLSERSASTHGNSKCTPHLIATAGNNNTPE